MAIAALPEDPRDPWERRTFIVLSIAAAVIAVLFVVSMLDAYVF